MTKREWCGATQLSYLIIFTGFYEKATFNLQTGERFRGAVLGYFPVIGALWTVCQSTRQILGFHYCRSFCWLWAILFQQVSFVESTGLYIKWSEVNSLIGSLYISVVRFWYSIKPLLWNNYFVKGKVTSNMLMEGWFSSYVLKICIFVFIYCFISHILSWKYTVETISDSKIF